jgi:uncharacterized protein (UPF0218 family)
MTIAYILTPELRRQLQKPIGILIRGTFSETVKQIRDLTDKEKPPSIISVGDTVTRNLMENRVFPQLSIVDNIVMRRIAQPISQAAEKIIHVKNPQGTITEEAAEAIQKSLKNDEHVRIIVDGEEDLLTLIAVQHAPINSFVIYGQPYEGAVVVKVTHDKKTEIATILKTMENARKAK